MKSLRTLSAIACALLLPLGATAQPIPITINFDDLTAAATFYAGDPVRESARLSTGYLNTLGVRFESISTRPYVAVVPLGSFHACSNNNGIAAADANDLIQGLFPIGVSFFVPSTTTQKQKAVTNYVSMKGDGWGQGPGGTPNRVEAYDVNGNLIVSTIFADTNCNPNFVSAPGIHSVRFIGNGSVGYDDLVFNPVAGVNSLTFQGVTFTTTLTGNVLDVEIDAAAPTGDWASAKYIDAIEVKNIGTYSSFTMGERGSGWAATTGNLKSSGCTAAGRKGPAGGACAQGNAQQLADDMHFTFTFDTNATLNGAAPSLTVRLLSAKLRKQGSMLGQPIPPLMEPAP